jgi:iron complex outermembrane recepter protein
MTIRTTTSATLAATLAAILLAGEARGAGRPLADLSLEELSNLQVTSVSRRAERVADAPDSVYVITAEDIRRSGASNIAEALRLAPNLQVAQVDARQYAITSRGFNATSSNKLLVLIDGRSVYTPLFSGVFWDVQDLLLEDVERIEVVSGPGGTLWGTNAVNGVINITTRPARDTGGPFAVVRSGNRTGSAGVRYGGALGAVGHYRVYGKTYEHEQTRNAAGSARHDAIQRQQAGFRADLDLARDRLTVQGDVYDGEFEQPAHPSLATVSGFNLLSRWTRPLGEQAALQVQAYYDRTERDHVGTFAETLDIFDIELQHSLRPHPRHQLVWGAGLRQATDKVGNSQALAFLPPNVNRRWTTLFGQDDIELRPDLRLTLGARFEHNDYTGTEVLPSARLAWRLGPERLAWAQLARAVRAPSRIDRELFAPGQPPFTLAGGPEFRSETLKSVELGYRAQRGPRLSYTAALFHHVYESLRSVEVRGGVQMLENNMEGEATGVEAWASYQATPRWRVSAGWTAMHQDLRLRSGSTAISTATEGNDPAHSWKLRSSHDFGGGVELDVMLRRIAALPNPAVPARTALDIRAGWQLRRDIELSIVGTNLLDRSEPEFGAFPGRSELQRGALARVIWRP